MSLLPPSIVLHRQVNVSGKVFMFHLHLSQEWWQQPPEHATALSHLPLGASGRPQ